MRDLLASIAALMMVAYVAAYNPFSTLTSFFQTQQVTSQASSIVSALNTYYKSYGKYPYLSCITAYEAKDDLTLKHLHDKGYTDADLSTVYEIDLSALKGLSLSKKSRYFMIQDNPMSAFNDDMVKRQGFKLDLLIKLFTFSNVTASSQTITVNSKTMTVVNTAGQYNENISLIGGGNGNTTLRLIEIVNMKSYGVLINAGGVTDDQVESVQKITSTSIFVKLTDGTFKVLDLNEVMQNGQGGS